MSLIRATPFHARVAAANRLNAWTNRNGYTLAAHYGDSAAEALAARTTVATTDISWRSRIALEGARVEEFLARFLTRDPAKLLPGHAFKALSLSDRGGVRGAYAVARPGRDVFQLIATEPDLDWTAQGAALFDVQVRDIVGEGGLAIIGPYAGALLAKAGFDPAMELLTFRKILWRDLDVMLSRVGEHGGYELWCKADDAPLVWNRLLEAGKPFALTPAGLEAGDILDLEAGVPRPGRDYETARDGFASTPTPVELGLESLIDSDHKIFNGRSAYLAAPRGKTRVGLELQGDVSMARVPLACNGRRVGETMSARYSPALQRAIALAIVHSAVAEPGTTLTFPDGTTARVAALPFLPAPDQIPA